MIIDQLYTRYSILVDAPDCDTFGNDPDKTIWRDARSQPTAQQLQDVSQTAVDAKVAAALSI